ncbi:MAG: haloacid dehalogenase-like hydrolase [Burkholderiales bacterium]
MRVGLDFDNTIVSYDRLFHKVALEGGWIPADTPVSKVSVRDHLRRIGKEEIWTQMQGTVYGARMAEAEAYPGAKEFLRWAREQGIPVCIVSHKTKHPFLGPKYDLHQAARDWIEQSLADDKGPLLAAENVYFELTKEEKIRRIASEGCSFYLDDLPEILLAPGFPASTERMLFDPDEHHRETKLARAVHWLDVQKRIMALWQKTP